MRLWHYKMIDYLPTSQLVAQWRELNSIFVKQDNHILINYVYQYPKQDLMIYTNIVLNQMQTRGFKIHTKSYSNYLNYFSGVDIVNYYPPFKDHHNKDYLAICYYNLYEKYLRNQKDFSDERYNQLLMLYNKSILE